MLTHPLQDVMFVETKSDLNVYYESGQGGATCPGIPASPGTASWKPTYDVNEWVGESSCFP